MQEIGMAPPQVIQKLKSKKFLKYGLMTKTAR